MSDLPTYMLLIEDCEAREQHLTDWERSFLDSIKTQLTRGRSLSEKQAERLDEIWEGVTTHHNIKDPE